jgi:hypothetical protein
MMVTKKLEINGRKASEEKVLDLKKTLEHESRECMKGPLTQSIRL